MKFNLYYEITQLAALSNKWKGVRNDVSSLWKDAQFKKFDAKYLEKIQVLLNYNQRLLEETNQSIEYILRRIQL